MRCGRTSVFVEAWEIRFLLFTHMCVPHARSHRLRSKRPACHAADGAAEAGGQEDAAPSSEALPATGRTALLLAHERAWAAAAPPVEEVAAQLRALLTGLQAPVALAVTPQVQ